MSGFRQLLTDSGMDQALLNELSDPAGMSDRRLYDRLLSGNLMDQDRLNRLWGEAIGVPYMHLKRSTIDPAALRLIPRDFAERRHVLAFQMTDGELCVAMDDPQNLEVMEEIRRMTRCRSLLPVFSTRQDIQEAIALHYSSLTPLQESVRRIDLGSLTPHDLEQPDKLKKLLGSEPIMALSDGLILRAMKDRASDIHLEALEQRYVVRFRVDGLLRDVLLLPKEVGPALVSRYKALAELDVTDRNKPHDGRFSFQFGERKVDLRVSTLPTLYGEKAALRLLDRHAQVLDLFQLGFGNDVLEGLQQVIHSPNGIFFVTGPTGSGKTTTLYAILNHLNTHDRNLITLEDPVEYQLSRVNQVQIRPKQGLDFVSGLRAVLRQDPDVIMVGEIRDIQTAQIATQAALTGHIVLASLHTNSALQALIRLVEMGVESFLVAPALIGVLGQRLVRQICPTCKEPAEDEQGLWTALGFPEGPYPPTWRGRGCNSCYGTGYYGRLPVHELLVLSNSMRQLIIQGSFTEQAVGLAEQEGFRPMRLDGIKKVMRGLTTLEEILRHTGAS